MSRAQLNHVCLSPAIVESVSKDDGTMTVKIIASGATDTVLSENCRLLKAGKRKVPKDELAAGTCITVVLQEPPFSNSSLVVGCRSLFQA